MGERGMLQAFVERGGWRYAIVSILLSANSWLCFGVYAKLHWSPFRSQHPGIIDLLKLTSDITAISALVLSLIAIRKGPWWIGVAALAASALPCASVMVIM